MNDSAVEWNELRSDVLFPITIGIFSLFGHHQRQTRLPQTIEIEIETQPVLTTNRKSIEMNGAR